jgi:mannose-6-phosphate isomerase-like protein (cupin superfamily)
MTIPVPRALLIVCASSALLSAADRGVPPTFLRANLTTAAEKPTAMTTANCHVKPLFGEGSHEARVARGLARYAHVTVDAGGTCAAVKPVREEQIAVVLEGQGGLASATGQLPLKHHDFLYLPSGVEYTIKNSSSGPLSLVLMGWRIPADPAIDASAKPLIANYDDVKLQQVGNHPPSTLYRLLVGDRKSTRDRIAAGHVVTSLFIMEFAPGGTNTPHAHDREEEVYLVLKGRGEMVAGGGVDGVENRIPVQEGDAFFFRLNTTVGFYSADTPDNKAVILAVRSLYPFRR